MFVYWEIVDVVGCSLWGIKVKRKMYFDKVD